MSFWRAGKARKHRWHASPEEHAKQLLITALGTAFGPHVEILDEVKAGAGRIDLYLRFGKALRVVLELKMCGGGSYTERYALDGLEQLAHYMEAKGTGLGLLVVFDGRTIDYGKGLRDVEIAGPKTIFVQGVDVRPVIREKKRTQQP